METFPDDHPGYSTITRMLRLQNFSNDISKHPVSHTCFNIFDLPAYPDKETMRAKVELALEHTEGFGLI